MKVDPYEVRVAMANLQETLDRLYLLRANGLRVPDAVLANISTWLQNLAAHEALVLQAGFR